MNTVTERLQELSTVNSKFSDYLNSEVGQTQIQRLEENIKENGVEFDISLFSPSTPFDDTKVNPSHPNRIRHMASDTYSKIDYSKDSNHKQVSVVINTEVPNWEKNIMTTLAREIDTANSLATNIGVQENQDAIENFKNNHIDKSELINTIQNNVYAVKAMALCAETRMLKSGDPEHQKRYETLKENSLDRIRDTLKDKAVTCAISGAAVNHSYAYAYQISKAIEVVEDYPIVHKEVELPYQKSSVLIDAGANICHSTHSEREATLTEIAETLGAADIELTLAERDKLLDTMEERQNKFVETGYFKHDSNHAPVESETQQMSH